MYSLMFINYTSEAVNTHRACVNNIYKYESTERYMMLMKNV